MSLTPAFDSCYCVITLAKLFTSMWLCHQALQSSITIYMVHSIYCDLCFDPLYQIPITNCHILLYINWFTDSCFAELQFTDFKYIVCQNPGFLTLVMVIEKQSSVKYNVDKFDSWICDNDILPNPIYDKLVTKIYYQLPLS